MAHVALDGIQTLTLAETFSTSQGLRITSSALASRGADTEEGARMSTFLIVAVVAILLIVIPAGLMQQRIRNRSEEPDAEARQAALDIQRDIDRGRAGF